MHLQFEQYRPYNPSSHKVGIPVLEGILFIPVAEIIFCKAENNRTSIHLTDGRSLVIAKTLKWVDSLLLAQGFYRVHGSYTVNLSRIIRYRPGGEGGVIELTGRYEIDVSRRKKNGFVLKLKQLKMIV